MRGSVLATRTYGLARALHALDELFDSLGTAFEQQGVDEQTSFWVKLAAEELFTNMVRHNPATGDKISMALDISKEEVRVSLTDHGVSPFDPDSVPPVDTSLPAEERTPGGLGVFIVRSKVDELQYRHSDGDMTVCFVKRRESTNG